MDKEFTRKKSIENQWLQKGSNWPSATKQDIEKKDDDAIAYVEIISKNISNSCGIYEMDFLKSSHTSKTICTVIKTSWRSFNGSGSSTKKVCVLPSDEEKLGCTGWENPTGPDTTYSREILSAWFK